MVKRAPPGKGQFELPFEDDWMQGVKGRLLVSRRCGNSEEEKNALKEIDELFEILQTQYSPEERERFRMRIEEMLTLKGIALMRRALERGYTNIETENQAWTHEKNRTRDSGELRRGKTWEFGSKNHERCMNEQRRGYYLHIIGHMIRFHLEPKAAVERTIDDHRTFLKAMIEQLEGSRKPRKPR